MAKKKREVSQTAVAVCSLQDAIPNARIVYSSATGATEPANLAYCSRLGLWGTGTPFANAQAFVIQIEGAGIAGLELIARDLKMRGLYASRSLSFDGVEYERLTHPLTDDQRTTYDLLCDGWQVVLRHFNAALSIVATNGNGNVDGPAKAAAMSAYWSSHQRFFSAILIAMEMPSVIDDIEKQLALGNCAVLQLTSTQEAMMDRQLAKLNADDDLSDIDMTPRDTLLQLVEHCFPVAQMESYHDGTNWKMRPLTDLNGNLILNDEAVAMRDELLLKIGGISCPDGPLEMLVNHFGSDNIAEVTGRRRRIVRTVIDGIERTVIEKRSPLKCQAEVADFQDGKRRVLFFSDAGGIGASYHAAATAKNQSRRIHYLVQAGWVADQALQGFGRSHRAGQATTPLFKLVSTDLHGQKRFISTIARRLDQLGALTRGQRQAAGNGLFTAADNLESEYARDALKQLYRDIYQGEVEGVGLEEFTAQTGLVLTNAQGQFLLQLPPVTRFLNRLLSVRIAEQNTIFDAYAKRIDAKIRQAITNDTFENGVETLVCASAVKLAEQVVNIDASSGAETKHVHLKLRHRTKPWSFEQIISMTEATHYQPLAFFAKNVRSGKTWAFCDAGDRTLANGSIVSSYYQVGPVSRTPIPKRELLYAAHWTKMTPEQARPIWEAQVADVPDFTEEDLHLITGAILPIWDKLKGNPRVKRIATDAGERLLGRVIPEDELFETLNKLGAGVDQSTKIADVVNRLLAGTHKFILSNGWALKRTRVASEYRIEVTSDGAVQGPQFSHADELKQYGVYFERGQDWRPHFYVPTDAMPKGRERTERSIEGLTKGRPIVRAVRTEVN